MAIYQRSDGQASRKRGRMALCMLAAAALLACLPGADRAMAQVPFVPTPPDVVARMLALAKVGADDYLIDLGSGDGRVVREAARSFGTRGFGVDLDAELVARSRELARRDGVADKVTFMAQDLFETRIADATVVTMYLLPAVNLKLRPRLLAELQPGTRVVSHDFDMAEWAPDETVRVHSPEKYGATGGDSTLYLWIVPADVSGRWQWQLQIGGQTLEYELSAAQRFQKIEGTVRAAGREHKLEQASLRGDTLTFSVVVDVKGSPVRQAFSGRVSGDAIQGEVASSGARLQGTADWSAERKERGFRSAAPVRPMIQAAGATAGFSIRAGQVPH